MRDAAVGSDDPADRPAGPVELGVGVLRPADLDAHARPFGAGRAIDDVDIARLARRDSRRRPRAGRPAAGRRRSRAGTAAAGRRCSGTVGQVIGGSFSACAYRASRPSFHLARCSCQMPSPIISATAATTMIVGMMGNRRIIRRSVLRARDAYIPAPSSQALATRSPPMVSAAATGTQMRCTHHGGSAAASSTSAPTDDDRADDQDQEGGRSVADVEAVEVEPAAPALVTRSRTQPANSPCAAAARAFAAPAPRRPATARSSARHPRDGAPQPPHT